MKFKTLVLLSGMLLLGFMSCSDDKEYQEETDPTPTEEVNKYITGTDLSKSYSLSNNHQVGHSVFNVLGYGYDVTGKYAHPAYIKAEVIDAAKCEAENDDAVHQRSVFSHGNTGAVVGTEQEVTSVYSEIMNIPKEKREVYTNVLKDNLNLPFINDSSFKDLDYYYASSSFVSSWYAIFFHDWDYYGEDILRYLTDEFKKDIIDFSGEDIIKKYGTHILSAIEVGRRDDFIYRSSSNNELEKRMLYSSAATFGKVPGVWMSPKPNSYLDKENIYYEMVGTKSPSENAWMVDFTNCKGGVIPTGEFEDMVDEECVLVDFMNPNWLSTTSLIPIYEVVKDEVKRQEILKAFEKYLSE